MEKSLIRQKIKNPSSDHYFQLRKSKLVLIQLIKPYLSKTRNHSLNFLSHQDITTLEITILTTKLCLLVPPEQDMMKLKTQF